MLGCSWHITVTVMLARLGDPSSEFTSRSEMKRQGGISSTCGIKPLFHLHRNFTMWIRWLFVCCSDSFRLIPIPKDRPTAEEMAIIPRTQQRHGWLRPAIGVVELSQSVIQVVPLSSRKATGAFSEGYGPFLQLPHFSESMVKKIAGKKIRSFQELREMNQQEHADLLTQVAGFSTDEAQDVEMVLEMMPFISVNITCETEGEEGITELVREDGD